MYDFDLLEMDFDEAVMMLTQYAHECEPIDIDAVKRLYKDEVLKTEIENNVSTYVSEYNEYLAETNDFESMLYETLDDLLCDAKPEEVGRAIFYGDYNYTYPYVRFNGYGNVESVSEFDIMDEMTTDDYFLDYLIEHDSNFNEEEYSELIKATNKELRREMRTW